MGGVLQMVKMKRGHTLMLEIVSALSACCREKNSENPDRCKSVPEGVPVNDI